MEIIYSKQLNCTRSSEIIIYKTTDYSIFNISERNRILNKAHIRLLKDSLLSNNLLSENPIMCDSELTVIDGQHRLECCKQLGVEVYFTINKMLSLNDAPSLNSCYLSWKLQDFVNSFIEDGNENYIKLNAFAKTYSIQIAIAFELLTTQNVWHGTKEVSKSLKSGTFIYPFDRKVLTRANEIGLLISEFKELNFFETTKTIIYSLIHLYNDLRFKKETFFSKCLKFKNRLYSYTSIVEQTINFMEVYNIHLSEKTILDMLPFLKKRIK